MTRRTTFLAGSLAVGVIVAALCRVQWIVSHGESIAWPATFTAVKDIAQTLTFAFGGWWTYSIFIRQRTDRLRADIGLSATIVTADAINLLMRVVLEIKNVGNVELCPYAASLHLQQFYDSAGGLQLPTGETGEALPGDRTIDKWREIDMREIAIHEDELTLEPGETERYPVDFLIPLGDKPMQVRVVVRADATQDGMYWDDTIVVPTQISKTSSGA
jgi:hypothetical protein